MKRRIVQTIALTLSLCMSLTLTAIAASKSLTITHNKQEQSLWCWAATCESLMLYEVPTFSKGSYATLQKKIVQDVKSSQGNSSATYTEWGPWLTSNSTAFSNLGAYVFENATNQQVLEYSIITKSKPVGVCLAKQAPGVTITGTAHLVTAYYADNSSRDIYVWDSWGSSSTFANNTASINWLFTQAGMFTNGMYIGAFGNSKCYARIQYSYYS